MRILNQKMFELMLIISKELENCHLCPRNCGVNRLKGEKGFCGVGGKGVIVREMINNYEEQGLNPSHQIYFAGCNLRCSYCSVEDWNTNVPQVGFEQQEIVAAVKAKESQSASLNLLGGEPAVNIAAIVDFLSNFSSTNPVIWNSNMYYNPVVTELTAKFTDIYLADFKCWHSGCCRDILGVDDYRKIAVARIKAAATHGRVIVRHLVMPGHLECCLKPIVNWLADELTQVEFSPRYNFIPFAERANCPKGYLDDEEKNKAKTIIGNFKLNITI